MVKFLDASFWRSLDGDVVVDLWSFRERFTFLIPLVGGEVDDMMVEPSRSPFWPTFGGDAFDFVAPKFNGLRSGGVDRNEPERARLDGRMVCCDC